MNYKRYRTSAICYLIGCLGFLAFCLINFVQGDFNNGLLMITLAASMFTLSCSLYGRYKRAQAENEERRFCHMIDM